MPDRTDEILVKIDRLDDKVDCIDRKLATMQGRQSVQCDDHSERIGKLENGTSRGIRTWGAIIAIIATIFGIFIAAASVVRGGH